MIIEVGGSMFRTFTSGLAAASLLFATAAPSHALSQTPDPIDEASRSSATCAVAMIREARTVGGEEWSLRGIWTYRYFFAEIVIRNERYDDDRLPIAKRAIVAATEAKTTQEILDSCNARLPSEGSGRALLSGDTITDIGACMFMAGFLNGSAPIIPSEAPLAQRYEMFGMKLIDRLKGDRRHISRSEQRVIDRQVAAMLRAAPDVEAMDQCIAKFDDAPRA